MTPPATLRNFAWEPYRLAPTVVQALSKQLIMTKINSYLTVLLIGLKRKEYKVFRTLLIVRKMWDEKLGTRLITSARAFTHFPFRLKRPKMVTCVARR